MNDTEENYHDAWITENDDERKQETTNEDLELINEFLDV